MALALPPIASRWLRCCLPLPLQLEQKQLEQKMTLSCHIASNVIIVHLFKFPSLKFQVFYFLTLSIHPFFIVGFMLLSILKFHDFQVVPLKCWVFNFEIWLNIFEGAKKWFCSFWNWISDFFSFFISEIWESKESHTT